MASLNVESQKHNKFAFSRDGSRLFSSTREGGMALWNGENGQRHVGVANSVGSIDKLAISDDGSFLAGTAKSWSGGGRGSLLLVDTLASEFNMRVRYLAFSRNLLATGIQGR
jgi:hypothetical protein